MLHRRTTRKLFTLVAAIAVVGVIGALPAAAGVALLQGTPPPATTPYTTGDHVSSTVIQLDDGPRVYGERVIGIVTVSDDDATEPLCGQVDLKVDGEDFGSVDLIDGEGAIDLGLEQPVGTHTLTATFTGDDVREASTDAVEFTIVKVPSDISIDGIDDLQFGVAGSVPFTITADEDPAGRATLYVDDGAGVTSDFEGWTATLEIPGMQSAGEHTLRLEYAGNDVVEGSETTTPFFVQQGIPDVTVDAAASSLVVGQAQTIAVRVATADGYLGSGDVEIDLADGDFLGTAAVLDGLGSLVLGAPLPAGVAGLSLYYAGDDNLEPAEGSGEVTVLKAAPTVVVTVPASTPYGDAVAAHVIARLPDGADGSGPLGATTVTFTATHGTTTVDVGTAVTDADGAADRPLPVDLAPGDWSIGASVAATSQTDAASATVAPLAVVGTASATAVALSKASVVVGSAATATVTVTGGAAAPSGSITLRVGDRALGTFALVGGTVQVPLPVDLAVGESAVVAAYPGAAGMLASSGTAKLTVTAAPIATPTLPAAPATAGNGATVVRTPAVSGRTAAARTAAAAKLASTGANVQDLIALAVALVVLGGGGVVVARRRGVSGRSPLNSDL